MLALSATITLILLEYICKSLKLRPIIRFYQESINMFNIIYLIREIIKPKYKDMTFLMLDSSEAGFILKIMIFVDTTDET